MKIAEFLLLRLEKAGIRHLFSVPGDYNLVLLQQLQDTGTLKWIGTCSELNAPYAADGYTSTHPQIALMSKSASEILQVPEDLTSWAQKKARSGKE